MKEHHNQTIEKRLQKHGSESPSLRSFNEGDTVCCHFPSKTIISDHKVPSKKLKMFYVGPLYIFSKHDKFLYLLTSIDGKVSRLKKGLLRLPNGKTVKNINDYRLEMVKQANNSTRTAPRHQSKQSCIFIMSPRQFVKLLIIAMIGIRVPLFSNTLVLTGVKIY